ncbi:MAG TPA: photosynthetic reaction center cytochrome c subunit family protein [Bdellovibrionales bacterium]|nr:photosynthetic reaction center cytochrome c subunit family protein [Bdellovibrionales bacterium]
MRVFRLAIQLMIPFLFAGISAAQTKAQRTAADDFAIREAMVKMSKQLGVTCNFCHDLQNFRSDKIDKYKVAKDHMRIVDLLNTQGFKGKRDVKADCYMCHRGKPVPDYKEPR